MRQELRSLTSSSTPRWCRRGSLGEDLWAPGKWSLGQNQNFSLSPARLVIKSVNRTVHEELYHLWESQVSPHNYHIWILGQQSIPDLKKKNYHLHLKPFSLCPIHHLQMLDLLEVFLWSIGRVKEAPEWWYQCLGRMTLEHSSLTSIFHSSCFSNPIWDRATREIMIMENL